MLERTFDSLIGTHDTRLPSWGPYTKKYAGISHIPDETKGIRFDFSIIPGLYRRKLVVPNVLWESGFHPWEALPDLSYYSFRYEIEWKDKVYCDVSYTWVDDDTRLVRCELTNNTNVEQDLVLHYIAYMDFPRISSKAGHDGVKYCTLELGSDSIWIDALDYISLEYKKPRPTDFLVPDGLYRGEIRDAGFIGGSGLGLGFSGEKGDKAVYTVKLNSGFSDAALMLRYRMEKGNKGEISFDGIVKQKVELVGTGDFSLVTIPLGNIMAGQHEIAFTSTGSAPFEIDGFILMPFSDLQNTRFVDKLYNPCPEIKKDGNSIILKYVDSGFYYGISWMFDQYEIREFYTEELDRFMRYTVHDHVNSVLKGSGDGHYTDVFLRPISMKPNSKRVVYGAVCAGDEDRVKEKLRSFALTSNADKSAESYEHLYVEKHNEFLKALNALPQSKNYLFSQQRMTATVLTNIVYPVYIKRRYIKHYTPGRWWDSLYTWDSGFIGLGLSTLDVERAIDCLNTYVTEPGDYHSAFIHHGSPVPVQFYLFLELWNRTQSNELLEYFYPRLKQYYDFFSGKAEGSSTRTFKSNLLSTWDYFYNSGGWDDYPPQVLVHKHKLEKYVAPVITTAQCVRAAKIMYMAAAALGYSDDCRSYNKDIEMFSESIQKYCWDDNSGYFSYVFHDDEGTPTGILTDDKGVNLNMGLDGIYPLIAGICSNEQKEILLRALMSDKQLWSETGISTVDQSAPYYREDGYWNGSVWMPHQWFIWKTMLDIGKGDIAYKIAITGLEVWEREVSSSYNCFEHFIIKTGRGAGWHQFSGLSNPILCWFNAYFTPGTLTCGFDVWIIDQAFSYNHTSLTARLGYFGSEDNINVVIVMNPDYNYLVKWNNSLAEHKELLPGVLQVELCNIGNGGVLSISHQ